MIWRVEDDEGRMVGGSGGGRDDAAIAIWEGGEARRRSEGVPSRRCAMFLLRPTALLNGDG